MYSLYIFVLAKLLSVQYLCPRSFLRESPYETQATRDRWVETGSLEWWLNLHPSAMCELHLCAQGGGHSKLHMHRGGTFRITCSVNNTFCHAMPNNKYSGTHTQTFLFWRPRDEIMVNPLHISKKSISSSNCKTDNFFGESIVQILQLQQNRFQAWSPVWGGGGGVPSRKYQKEQGLQTWEQQPEAFLTQSVSSLCRTKDRTMEF